MQTEVSKSVNKKVLIVEDNELNLKLFTDLLRAHGYTIEPLRDGRGALRGLLRGDPVPAGAELHRRHVRRRPLRGLHLRPRAGVPGGLGQVDVGTAAPVLGIAAGLAALAALGGSMRRNRRRRR